MTLKNAFRRLARQYHLDVAKDKKAAEAKLKELNEAHKVLSDPEENYGRCHQI
jgi:curved DNA-binding protein